VGLSLTWGRNLTRATSVLALSLLTTVGIPTVASAGSGRIVVIVLENKPYPAIVGSSEAPYINSLIAQGKLFTNYVAVKGGSKPNYLAMTSGLTTALSPPSPNVFQAIDSTDGAQGWRELEESMKINCGGGSKGKVPGTSVGLYTKGHDPAYQYRANDSCTQNDVPMTSSTFDPAALPTFTYIVPNQCDDMHTLPTNGQSCPAYFGSNTGSTAIGIGDGWLSHVVPQLLAQPDITVLITWDESGASTTPPEHIVTLEVGAGITAGSTDGRSYNHYGLEAGLYSALGLGTAPNNGATATPLPIPSVGSAPPPPSGPVINGFSPTSGPVGTLVTINGSGFTGVTDVRFFNGVSANYTFVSDTQITATVPSGATTGPISVTAGGLTGTSSSNFTVTTGQPSTLVGSSLGSGSCGAATATSGTTPSIGPSTSVVFLWATTVNTGGAPSTITSVSGLSGTWTVYGSVASNNGNRRLTLVYGTGVSGSGALTVNYSAATDTSPRQCVLDEFTGGIDPANPIVAGTTKTASPSVSATSVQVTPNPLASAGNAFYVGVNHRTAESVTPYNAAASTITDGNAASAQRASTNYLDDYASGGMGGTWATSNVNAVALGVEIAVAPT
jgi:hypothetical protein